MAEVEEKNSDWRVIRAKLDEAEVNPDDDDPVEMPATQADIDKIGFNPDEGEVSKESGTENNSEQPVSDSKQTKDWIGVDLDGTLAHYEGWNDGKIGEPIPEMVEKIKQFLKEGKEVKIFTARIAEHPEEEDKIKKWLVDIGLPELEVVNEKDKDMELILDDRARQVKENTGKIVEEK